MKYIPLIGIIYSIITGDDKSLSSVLYTFWHIYSTIFISLFIIRFL